MFEVCEQPFRLCSKVAAVDAVLLLQDRITAGRNQSSRQLTSGGSTSGDDPAANHCLVGVILRLAEEHNRLAGDHLDHIAATRRNDHVNRVAGFSVHRLNDRWQHSRSRCTLQEPKGRTAGGCLDRHQGQLGQPRLRGHRPQSSQRRTDRRAGSAGARVPRDARR